MQNGNNGMTAGGPFDMTPGKKGMDQKNKIKPLDNFTRKTNDSDLSSKFQPQTAAETSTQKLLRDNEML